MNTSRIFGYSFCNPVEVEADYLKFTVDYCIKAGINHIQIIGPIHDSVLGNVDGMTLYKKYARFNEGKNPDYIESTTRAFAEVLPAAHAAGIRSYVWHHELELPDGFAEAFPETLNETGDFEVSHPLIRDFLEQKIFDFFDQYPDIDGIVLTLHETRVPLLKLQHQKLNREERVQYVTGILYEACAARGKELIVRPFASIPEDYSMLMNAYAAISPDLVVMDKWTQFDWSLCAPHNSFFDRIKVNPLMVEADIFGEFFGKGRLPLMLLDHIKQKAAYCESHNVRGYCARIDRNGMIPFGDVNEVNLPIMEACMRGEDPDAAALRFFEKRYPGAGAEVFELMRSSEDIVKHIIYLRGYYFSELSYFPGLNHCKNHFYFEMMRESFRLVSGEWFIPVGWERGSLQEVRDEKAKALADAKLLRARLEELKGLLSEGDYKALLVKFENLCLVARAWCLLVEVFYSYENYFALGDESLAASLEEALNSLLAVRDEGARSLGTLFYCFLGDKGETKDFIGEFVADVRATFAAEKALCEALRAQAPRDFVICGGCAEGHALMKEVNFSDTGLMNGAPYRVPGHDPKRFWSMVNTHGWFSYELAAAPGCLNTLELTVGSFTDTLALKLTIGDSVTEIRQKTEPEKPLLFRIPFRTEDGQDRVRIRLDRLSADTPFAVSMMTK